MGPEGTSGTGKYSPTGLAIGGEQHTSTGTSLVGGVHNDYGIVVTNVGQRAPWYDQYIVYPLQDFFGGTGSSSSSESTSEGQYKAIVSAALSVGGNVAGVGTGFVLTAAGAGLFAVPSPGITQTAGVITMGVGITNIVNSGAGLPNSMRNLVNAINGDASDLPDSGTNLLVEALYPG